MNLQRREREAGHLQRERETHTHAERERERQRETKRTRLMKVIYKKVYIERDRETERRKIYRQIVPQLTRSREYITFDKHKGRKDIKGADWSLYFHGFIFQGGSSCHSISAER